MIQWQVAIKLDVVWEGVRSGDTCSRLCIGCQYFETLLLRVILNHCTQLIQIALSTFGVGKCNTQPWVLDRQLLPISGGLQFQTLCPSCLLVEYKSAS